MSTLMERWKKGTERRWKIWAKEGWPHVLPHVLTASGFDKLLCVFVCEISAHSGLNQSVKRVSESVLIHRHACLCVTDPDRPSQPMTKYWSRFRHHRDGHLGGQAKGRVCHSAKTYSKTAHRVVGVCSCWMSAFCCLFLAWFVVFFSPSGHQDTHIHEE